MPAATNRAPIDYEELRRPYNTVRLLAASAFFVTIIVRSFVADELVGLLLLLGVALIIGDAAYRRSTPGTDPVPSLYLDATVICLGLAYHGSDPGFYGLTLVIMLLIGAVMLPPIRALGLVAYMVVLMGISIWLDAVGAPFVGALQESSNTAMLDAVFVAWFVAAAAAIIFLGMRIVLAQQDRAARALAQERRAVELKNEFVSMVSHELRTPLTGISGFTQTLAETWPRLPKHEVDEFLDIMGRETNHLSNLVEDILVIPRLEAGQLRMDVEELDLAVEIHAVSAMVLDESELSVGIPAGVSVDADRTRLHQVLRNLLENARKYGGDEVLIEGERATDGTFHVAVSDNGPGVPDADRERIFEHFEQLSTGDGRTAQGVGLGLPIARKLCRAMGGDLWYEGRFPTGATFRFSLPLANAGTPDLGAAGQLSPGMAVGD